jgi:hypothetical protein
MSRITKAQLQGLVDHLNAVTNSPKSAYTRTKDGRNVANVGNWHLSQAYGGYCVHRMCNEGGGVTTPITHGHVSARELYDAIHNFLRGMRFHKEEMSS